MSLQSFHILFIGAATMLALVLALWCFQQNGQQTVLGVLSILSAMGLVAYGFWARRKFREIERGRM